MQVKVVEPSHLHTDTVEAAAMADRASGNAKLPAECIPGANAPDCCTCGSPWQSASRLVATRQGVQSYIYHLTAVQPTTVYRLSCQCGSVLSYDGIEDALLNLNNVDLFSHELLRW